MLSPPGGSSSSSPSTTPSTTTPASWPPCKPCAKGEPHVSIDDTGSGYSSLAHILKLAPDFIKLDRDLVSGIDVDPVRRALAGSLVRFATETGAQIVAEGVETEDELAVLRQLGLRYGQGYYLGRPASLENLLLPKHRPTAQMLLKGAI